MIELQKKTVIKGREWSTGLGLLPAQDWSWTGWRGWRDESVSPKEAGTPTDQSYEDGDAIAGSPGPSLLDAFELPPAQTAVNIFPSELCAYYECRDRVVPNTVDGWPKDPEYGTHICKLCHAVDVLDESNNFGSIWSVVPVLPLPSFTPHIPKTIFSVPYLFQKILFLVCAPVS